MATMKNEVANNANEIASSANKTANVYISVGEVAGENKTIVGFGSLKPYQNQEGQQKSPSAKDVFYKVSQIDNFLKSVEANKIGIDIKGTDRDGHTAYMQASTFYKTGIGENGKAFGFNKLAITVTPEIKTPAGEIQQQEQKLYATKGKAGYSFDSNCDNALIAKFNEAVKGGAEFTLRAKKNETLREYPKLMEIVDKVKGGSANIELAFVKEQGAVIKNIVLNDKSGNAIGEAKLENHVTAQKSKDIER